MFTVHIEHEGSANHKLHQGKTSIGAESNKWIWPDLSKNANWASDRPCLYVFRKEVERAHAEAPMMREMIENYLENWAYPRTWIWAKIYHLYLLIMKIWLQCCSFEKDSVTPLVNCYECSYEDVEHDRVEVLQRSGDPFHVKDCKALRKMVTALLPLTYSAQLV